MVLYEMLPLIFFLIIFNVGLAFSPATHHARIAAGANPSSSLTASSAALSENSLVPILKKTSKTLSVILEINGQNMDSASISTRSMQLRQLKSSALWTSDLRTALECVKEQASAAGSFPGPCPVLYSGTETEAAIQGGVSAVVCAINDEVSNNEITRIYSVDQMIDGTNLQNLNPSIFLVDSASVNLDHFLKQVPQGSVVIASVDSMQPNNAELGVKALQAKGVHAILVKNAVVGDNEDLEYSSFVVDGLVKKKSSTFNMSGTYILQHRD
jgi:hypothetical protein